MLPRGYLVGNICLAPEIKQTQQGKEFINLVVACTARDKNKENKSHFINLNSGLENVNFYIKNGIDKGDKVLIDFSLHTYIGTDDKKHIGLSVENIELLSRSKSSEYKQESTEDFLNSVSNDEIAEALNSQEQESNTSFEELI